MIRPSMPAALAAAVRRRAMDWPLMPPRPPSVADFPLVLLVAWLVVALAVTLIVVGIRARLRPPRARGDGDHDRPPRAA